MQDVQVYQDDNKEMKYKTDDGDSNDYMFAFFF